MHRIEISNPTVSAEYEKNKSAFYMLSADMEEWYTLWSAWLAFRQSGTRGDNLCDAYQTILFERLDRFFTMNKDRLRVSMTRDFKLLVQIAEEGKVIDDNPFALEEQPPVKYITFKNFIEQFFMGGLTATDLREFFLTQPFVDHSNIEDYL